MLQEDSPPVFLYHRSLREERISILFLDESFGTSDLRRMDGTLCIVVFLF